MGPHEDHLGSGLPVNSPVELVLHRGEEVLCRSSRDIVVDCGGNPIRIVKGPVLEAS